MTSAWRRLRRPAALTAPLTVIGLAVVIGTGVAPAQTPQRHFGVCVEPRSLAGLDAPREIAHSGAITVATIQDETRSTGHVVVCDAQNHQFRQIGAFRDFNGDTRVLAVRIGDSTVACALWSMGVSPSSPIHYFIAGVNAVNGQHFYGSLGETSNQPSRTYLLRTLVVGPTGITAWLSENTFAVKTGKTTTERTVWSVSVAAHGNVWTLARSTQAGSRPAMSDLVVNASQVSFENDGMNDTVSIAAR